MAVRQHSDTTLLNDAGIRVSARSPVIVSASRSTDIPAFYTRWFFHRLDRGYSSWTNPFSGVRSYISFDKTRFIVFWSKNPSPLLSCLPLLKKRGIGCYVQYTLNDYDHDGLEPGVPPLQQRIDTFRRLVDSLGYGSVVWRFDPLLLTATITPDLLMRKIDNIARQLDGYTEKLVFSFADIASYRKVRGNLTLHGVDYREWDKSQMTEMAQMIASAYGNRLQLATCCEQIDLGHLGISHNKCIDDALIARIAHDDKALMDHLGMKTVRITSDLFSGTPVIPHDAIALGDGLYAIRSRSNRDAGQRAFCGCIEAKDIGSYNTCPHLCRYCYANVSEKAVTANRRIHLSDPLGESII